MLRRNKASTLELKNKHRQLTTSIEQMKASHFYPPPLVPHEEMPKETINIVIVRSNAVVVETQEHKLDNLRNLVARIKQETYIYCHNLQCSRERLNQHIKNLRKLSPTFEEYV
ncbi:hypothetical protein PanWU01x14_108680 [Parasponia andersonii]|uniref:Uncharacterized protein n=1 Tax=Parasponia andersonii TaxID=3476 RepID=A0A2P5CZZ9_PARAD|nr:hypothetical protein PanWU01x14_108680 [Parasponia andersonii]